MDMQSITPDLWIQNESSFLQQLKELAQWNSIPSLNVNDVQNFQDKKLVKFRGMVQDMLNPEYYLELFEVVNESTKEKVMRNGKFTDVINCKDTEMVDHESPNNVTNSRHMLVVITVPALNEWVHNIEKSKLTIPQPPTVRLPQNSIKKRSLENVDEQEMETDAIKNQNTENKKHCIAEPDANKQRISHEQLLNFPLPGHRGKACHVKVYNDGEAIKLNDIVEVVGFLSVDPALANVDSEEHTGIEMEIQTYNPPPSLIPRIHCVAFKKIGHSNPLFDERILGVDRIQSVKKELHIVLTQLLLGDALAAEYLIYHLISKVYIRNEFVPLGKFALNISNVPEKDQPDFGKHLSEYISLMVPTSHYLPMTLENINKLTFTPEKDYTCDKLKSGILQLSANTHLILDETKLTSGRLNESGVKSITALSNAIKNQKIVYDFCYYPVEYDCDIAFLILSEGKTLLSSDFEVRLNPDDLCIQTYEEMLEAAKIFLKPELLNDIRVYLTQARHCVYEFKEDVQELVQNEYVRLRQSYATYSSDDLHQLLVLARLVCLSEGKTCLDAESWKRACELEDERRKRLN